LFWQDHIMNDKIELMGCFFVGSNGRCPQPTEFRDSWSDELRRKRMLWSRLA
jgi:hypothetical protein